MRRFKRINGPIRLKAAGACLLLGIGLAAASARGWDCLEFDLPSGSRERLWCDALAARLGGVTEQTIALGRVDVVTSNEVIEVDWVRKWKEGMGQALAYAGETGKAPVLALIAYGQGAANLQPASLRKVRQAEKECARHGVRLLVLFPTRPEAFPHSTNAVAAGRDPR